KAIESLSKFCSKVFPIYTCYEQVQGIYNCIDTFPYCPPQQIPIQIVHQAIEGRCKCIYKIGDLRAYILPGNCFLDLCKAFVNPFGYIGTKPLKIFTSDQASDLIRYSLYRVQDWDIFK